MKTPNFIIVAVSSNRNAFGLHSILALNPQGEGWQFLQYTPCGKAGDKLAFHPSEAFRHGGECSNQLPSVDAKTASKLLKSIKRHVSLS
jgi:hypothetical protein